MSPTPSGPPDKWSDPVNITSFTSAQIQSKLDDLAQNSGYTGAALIYVVSGTTYLTVNGYAQYA